jgi:hypothetical protein
MTTLTPSDLTSLFNQTVIVTEIREPVAPANGALVFWDDGANEGVIIQPLYTDKDRDAMRRQMLRIAEEQMTRRERGREEVGR